jgi:hypothetical protein
MTKKIRIFDELMEGFRDAIARKGHRVALRLTQLPRLRGNRGSQAKKVGPTSSS